MQSTSHVNSLFKIPTAHFDLINCWFLQQALSSHVIIPKYIEFALFLLCVRSARSRKCHNIAIIVNSSIYDSIFSFTRLKSSHDIYEKKISLQAEKEWGKILAMSVGRLFLTEKFLYSRNFFVLSYRGKKNLLFLFEQSRDNWMQLWNEI